jgi:cysteine desulfurase/selenocysteine lyase
MSTVVTINPNPQTKGFDVHRIREDFPVLHRLVNNKPLVYLDNAATTQKPQCVINSLVDYYQNYNANIHRGVHTLSQTATTAYEDVRRKVQGFINAKHEHEIIFVRNTTEAINLVARCYGGSNIQEGDEVVVTAMEHHSNIVPWQMICEAKGAHLKVIPINDEGEVLLDEYKALLNQKTKLVGLVHVSNALGTINPAKEMIKIAHELGIPVLVDGAQSTPHVKVDVQDLDADFYTLSAHKMFAPTGIGVLYGKEDLLNAMPPFLGGGDMISSVSFAKTTYAELPNKFEAGTPNIADTIAFGAAIDYINQIGLKNIQDYEDELLRYGTEALSSIDEITLIGTAENKASVISFNVKDIHPHDIGTIVDQEGVAVRTGHHCAEPVMKRMNVTATARASLAMYNTKEEIDVLVSALHKAIRVFGG